ncbi:MAG: DUF3489 domain-containing protein [Hyphomicrobiales bacterium]|nr:DUF3489 domain-containing protein [Hyphomicrobiales bacterium]
MTTTTKPRKASTKTQAADAARTPPDCDAPTPRPGGKLGLIIDRLAATSGAAAEELVAMTGWQRHTIRGALSRLKSRGFPIQMTAGVDRRAYRLEASGR